MVAENTAGKQGGRPFQKGQSGNPSGRPKGARNHATRAVLALLDGEAEAITRKAVELALEGDGVALRLCLERLCPPRKDSPITLAGLPKIESAADLHKATARILEAVAKGTITLSEGQVLAGLVEAHGRVLMLSEDGSPQGAEVESPEDFEKRMANRVKARCEAIERQKTDFLPARQAEIHELKENCIQNKSFVEPRGE